MVTSGRLGGKVAVVTGAGSGLGLAMAVRFGADQAAVVCVDVRGHAAAARQIVAAGGRALAVRADVTDEGDLATVVEQAVATYGHLDTVVANAGIPGSGSAADVDAATWRRVIEVNLTGVWLTVRAGLKAMMAHGEGSVVTMASIGGLIGVPMIAPYAAAKGGVIALTRQIAADYGPSGIRANAIAPGTIRTPMTDASAAERAALAGLEVPSAEERAAKTAASLPLRRTGTPEDIANLAVFLASDESSWITGQVHVADGGRTAI